MTTDEYLYWGEPWPSGVCDEATQSNTYPLGDRCLLCGVIIVEGESGTYIGDSRIEGWPMKPVHKECSLRSVLGGIGHHEDHVYWCTIAHDPDGGRTYRHSALAVWEKVGKGEIP
jgi:hypothetical protein